MNSQTSVINAGGDYEETIERLAKHLGRDKNRRAVFNLLYGRGSKPRSKKQIAELLGISGTAQVVQNSLDELARHHLVVRVENQEHVKDGSRWVYSKDGFVRANRDKIVRYADDPKAAKKIATKRRPVTTIGVSFVVPSTSRASPTRTRSRAAPRKPDVKLRIALLITNPDYHRSLQTAIEARDIERAIKLGSHSDQVDLKLFPAPTFDTLVHALNVYKPDVLHFSGHGGGRALVFDNEKAGDDGGTILDFDMVARLIATANYKPRLLVLAACDTVNGADRFLGEVPAIIAMRTAVDDDAACAFSASFYQSLTSGASIASSLAQAKLGLEHKGYKDADTPQLLARDEKSTSVGLL